MSLLQTSRSALRWLAPSCPAPAASWHALAMSVATVLLPALVRADVEWHADLETARAAARISHRPVLAVFVAAWEAGGRPLETSALGSPEAEAVLDTCFEPVRIDVDEHAELTHTVGITHVPTACVLADDGTALETFEMPSTPAAFVRSAILAAQRAAARDQEADVAAIIERSGAAPTGPAPEPLAVTAAAFGSTPDNPVAGVNRPPRGSLSRVTAKVRDLSAFAADQVIPTTVAAPATIAKASRTVEAPRSTYEPVSWPAEPATATPTAPAPAIEPAPASLTPATVSPWLDAPPVGPATTAAAVPPPPASPTTTSPLPAPVTPTPGVEPAPGGLMATLPKPFALFGRQAADPPTVPPALPRNPLTGASPPVAATPSPTVTDPYGSMPLGLEGYCPVTLVDRGAWKEGRAQWGARHRGRTYLFAGPEEQRVFLANPDRYAPALSGDDPVLALDGGSSTPGQRRYGVTYQSRMYLFATPETRSAFSADPARYAGRIALAERPEAAAGGTRLY